VVLGRPRVHRELWWNLAPRRRGASISVDPDGAGGVPPEQVKPFTQFEKRGVYTGFFFDYEWEGPDGTEGVVLVTGTGGTSAGYALYLTLEHLTPWTD